MTTKSVRLAFALCAMTGVSAFGAEGNMYGNQTQNEGFFIVPKKGEVKIDGKIDPAEWDLSGQIWSFADWDSREMFSVKTAAMWDQEAVYLCFDWRDPTPLNSKVDPKTDPSHGWTADAIQIRTLADGHVDWITMWGFEKGTIPCFDFVHSAKDSHPDDTKFQHERWITYAKNPGETRLEHGVELAYAPAADGKGFTQEVKIPWPLIRGKENAGVARTAGEKFRMGVEFYWANAQGSGWPLHNYKDNLQPGVYTREFFWTARNSWGDATLAAGPVEKRMYVHRGVRPEGTISVRFDLPENAEFFTLVLDTKGGERVRAVCGGERVDEFTVAKKDGKATVEVMWDGLDDAGKLVSPGDYVVKALVSGTIDGYWETTFYNPGTPAWETGDSKGAWGADHCPIDTLCRAGDAVICCSAFAEGGYACFALGKDGRKLWSDKRGSSVVAGDGKYVFIVPNDWENSGTQLLRIESATGRYAPFTKGGDMPIGLDRVFALRAGATPPRILGLALNSRGLLMACSDDTVRVVDPETGVVTDTLKLHVTGFGSRGLFVADDDSIYSFFGREIRRTDLASGKSEFLTLRGGWFEAEPRIGDPGALTLGADGLLYVADNGPDSQVKVFTKDGRLVRKVGKAGGRNRQGAFDRDGMLSVRGLALDAEGNLWVAEAQEFPRRVSVWTKDGAFLRDYLGNSGYAGGGTLIHRQDPTKGVAKFNEISIDPKTGKWDVTNIMFNPDESKGTVIRPSSTAFHYGDLYYSSASGERREYFSSLGSVWNSGFFIMMRAPDGNWSPVAAIAPVAGIQHLLGGTYGTQVVKASYGEWAGNDPCDTVIWNDFNNDGYVTRDECEIVPSLSDTNPKGAHYAGVEGNVSIVPAGNTTTDMEDLGFVMEVRGKSGGGTTPGWGRMVPVSYRDGGRPVYSMKGYRPYANPGFRVTGAASEVPGKDTVVGFVTGVGGRPGVCIAAWRKSDAKLLWSYPSPYHQVHGSHNAPMPRPGLSIGGLKVAGVAPGCGDSDVFMVRGNLGEDYFFTADGFYVNRYTRDCRLPSPETPQTEEEMRKTSYRFLGGRGEHFSGTFARHDDGVIRVSGAIPSNQGCSVAHVEGLERIRHAGSAALAVSAADVVRADRDNSERALAKAKKPEAIVIGRDLKTAKEYSVRADGQSVRATFRAAYDQTALHLAFSVRGDTSPWKNGAKDWRLLFKGGDCVDFQLSPGGNAKGAAAAGDFRLLVAPFGGEPAAVLLMPKTNGASAPYAFNSPVQTVRFDRVERLAVKPAVRPVADGADITLDVPWTALGMAAPASGAKMTGDVGVIASDRAGEINVARIYRANKQTNLVNDQPGEALLQPAAWSDVVFE